MRKIQMTKLLISACVLMVGFAVQEQVVSPAFRIDDLVSTGVEEVAAAGDAREVARYSVEGRQLSAPQPGLNIIKMSDGTSRKVWVK